MKQFDNLKKFVIYFLQVSVIFGGAWFVIYSLRNNFYSSGITLGGSFLFLLLSMAGALVYGVELILLYAVGALVYHSVHPVIFAVFRAIKKSAINKKVKLEGPELIAVSVGAVIIFIFWWLVVEGQVKKIDAIYFAICGVYVYLFWNFCIKNRDFMCQKIKLMKEEERVSKIIFMNENRELICWCVFLGFPFFLMNIQSALTLSVAAQMAGIEVASAVVAIPEKQYAILSIVDKSIATHKIGMDSKGNYILKDVTLKFVNISSVILMEVRGDRKDIYRMEMPATECIFIKQLRIED